MHIWGGGGFIFYDSLCLKDICIYAIHTAVLQDRTYLETIFIQIDSHDKSSRLPFAAHSPPPDQILTTPLAQL